MYIDNELNASYLISVSSESNFLQVFALQVIYLTNNSQAIYIRGIIDFTNFMFQLKMKIIVNIILYLIYSFFDIYPIEYFRNN